MRGTTVNTEVTAVVEKQSEERTQESCTERVFVELGQVTKETKGGSWGNYDGGIFRLG